MKVLMKGTEIVSFPMFGGDKMETIAGEQVDSAQVAEMAEGQVKLAVAKQLAKAKKDADDNDLRKFTDAHEFNRDLKWIDKRLADVEAGTEGITYWTKGAKMGLTLPEGSEKDRTEGMEVGSIVAVGPTISPRQLINARGIVVSINGKVEVELEEGDLDRVKRATGKNFRNPVKFHRETLEVIG